MLWAVDTPGEKTSGGATPCHAEPLKTTCMPAVGYTIHAACRMESLTLLDLSKSDSIMVGIEADVVRYVIVESAG